MFILLFSLYCLCDFIAVIEKVLHKHKKKLQLIENFPSYCFRQCLREDKDIRTWNFWIFGSHFHVSAQGSTGIYIFVESGSNVEKRNLGANNAEGQINIESHLHAQKKFLREILKKLENPFKKSSLIRKESRKETKLF